MTQFAWIYPEQLYLSEASQEVIMIDSVEKTNIGKSSLFKAGDKDYI